MEHKWERPELPEANKGAGLLIGWLMIIGGVIAGSMGLSAVGDPYADFSGGAVASLGIASACMGLVFVPACMIMREIRQSAFEAALRAGEVTVEEKTTPDPYEQFLERERATAADSGTD